MPIRRCRSNACCRRFAGRELSCLPGRAVVPRACGVSSTPRLLGSLIDVSEYWIARLRGRRLQGVAPTCPRHCERSEAIHSFFARRDGLRRCARNDGAKYESAFSRRHAPELLKNLPPSKTEGAGKAGCALHPRSRVPFAQKNAHTSIQVQRRTSGLPCAMVLRSVLSPVTGLSCHRHFADTSTKLDASIGASGPHDFAVRIGRARQSQLSRPPHPTARFVTIASRPSFG
jgi:hypothetical protein